MYAAVDHGAAYEEAITGRHGDQLRLAYDEGKGKDAPPPDLCGWCEKLGAKLRCSQCKVEVYCNRDCQRVGTGRGEGQPAAARGAAAYVLLLLFIYYVL